MGRIANLRDVAGATGAGSGIGLQVRSASRAPSLGGGCGLLGAVGVEAFEDIDGALELGIVEVAEGLGFGVAEGVVAPPAEEFFLWWHKL